MDQVDCTYDVSQCHKDNLPWQQQSNTDTPKIAANTAFLFISYLGTLTHLFELWPWVSFSVSMCFLRLTTYFGKDGLPGDQCHDIMLRRFDGAMSLPDEVKQTFRDFDEWNSITAAERLARSDNDPAKQAVISRRFFDAFHHLSAQHELSRFAPACLANSNVRVRDCLEKTFAWLNRWDVPFLVVSAGLREFLVPILEKSGAPLPSNTVLLSNSLEEAAVSVTSPEKVHALKLVPEFMTRAEGRTQVLLLGDKPSDCNPLAGLPETPALKIAFLGEPSEEKFEQYLKIFDAVLVGDASMDFVNCLLDTVSNTVSNTVRDTSDASIMV